jgi:hypothetical protein
MPVFRAILATIGVNAAARTNERRAGTQTSGRVNVIIERSSSRHVFCHVHRGTSGLDAAVETPAGSQQTQTYASAFRGIAAWLRIQNKTKF